MSSTPKSIKVESPVASVLDQEKNATDPAVEEHEEDESGYISGIRLGLIVLGLCLAVLLVGLVSLSSPISRITS